MGGFKGRATTCTNLQIHLVHRHVRDTVVILEGGNHPHPRCPVCDMFITWAALNCHHPVMSLCVQGAESNIRRVAEDEHRVGTVTMFQAYDRPLEIGLPFKYL